MSARGVRRDKAALSSGCKSHPATAPAGSNRSSYGGNEVAEAFRHRQTKEAATDMFSLQPPRHIPTLPMNRLIRRRQCRVCFSSLNRLQGTANLVPRRRGCLASMPPRSLLQKPEQICMSWFVPYEVRYQALPISDRSRTRPTAGAGSAARRWRSRSLSRRQRRARACRDSCSGRAGSKGSPCHR
jgi:hypothetical protein